MSIYKDYSLNETKLIMNTKDVFTLEELALYTNYKKSYIYQLVHRRAIPAHKPPNGKKLFFSKIEIDEWLLSRKLETVAELKFNLKK